MKKMSLQSRLLASTIAFGALSLGMATAAAAQSTPQDEQSRLPTAGQLPPSQSGQVGAPAADGTDAGDVVVTGSRIVGNTTSASPLQIVDSQAIRSTGAANLQDVLLQSPVFGTPAVSRTNSNFSTSGAGLATIDLRNLGTSRTLVLVNGRRFVSGSPNDQAVDLNTIPTAFIDRVETLTGGASSLYGSDAVAGVVNIVYKNNFQGVELNGQAGISEKGDDASKQINLTVGTNTGDGKGNVIAYLGYSRDGAVFSRNRDRSAIDQVDRSAALTGDINDVFSVVTPNFSSFAPQGRFFGGASGGTIGTFDAGGNFITGFSANGTATRAPDGFNRSAYRTIAIPVERFLMATRANYEVAPAVNVFLEGTFAKSHTHTDLEPFPISSSGTNGIFQGTGGFFPVEQRLANGTIFVNPFVPAALLARLTDRDGDGLRDVSFTQRLTGIGDRTATADRTTYRMTAGVDGNIGTKFKYDTYLTYGRTDDNQTSTGQVNLANFRSALVVTQVNGQLVCADVNARAQGCVPANVFGANKLSAAAAQYIRADGNRNAYADQFDTGANISGNLFDPWGAGPVGIAVGGEYRRESSAAAFDALSQAGLNGGNAIPNTSGAFDVKEAYGELKIPILHDSFIKDLSFDGAGRVSDYSTVGTVFSWNVGGEFTPFSGLRFRAVRARATRAPNVTELFQGASQTFPTGLNDPCLNVTATSTGATSVNCRAAPGVNANIAANGKFTQTQADQQGISGFDSGNPNLKQEVGDTLTVGAVINPRDLFGALRNLSLTVDYTRTRIKGAIVGTPRQFILNQCYQQGDQSFCQFITRRAAAEGANSAGSLQFINSGVSNSGGVFNSVLDVTANYLQDLSGLGIDAKLSLGGSYDHVFKFYQVPLPGADKDQIAGEVGASKDRFLATAGLDVGGVRLQYRGTYFGRAYLDDQYVLGLVDGTKLDANGDPTAVTNAHDPRVRIPSKFYSDLQMQALAGEHFEFYFGVNNLFDVSPPPIISGLPGDVTGAETDSGTYDAIGRRFYAGARIRF